MLRRSMVSILLICVLLCPAYAYATAEEEKEVEVATVSNPVPEQQDAEPQSDMVEPLLEI